MTQQLSLNNKQFECFDTGGRQSIPVANPCYFIIPSALHKARFNGRPVSGWRAESYQCFAKILAFII